MIELLHRWLFHVLGGQVVSVLIMALGKGVVFDGLYTNHLWHAIVEWSRAYELLCQLNTLGAVQADSSEFKSRSFGGSSVMVAPARVRETQILTSAVTCYELGALLTARTMTVIDTDCASLAILNEGKAVELMDEVARYRPLQTCMRFLEMPFHDLYGETFHILRGMFCQEPSHICLKALVGEVSMKKTHPQDSGKGVLHEAFPLPLWDLHDVFFFLGRPCSLLQNGLELRAALLSVSVMLIV
jgi:hypothetical protein